jgi:hypothetical protein
MMAAVILSSSVRADGGREKSEKTVVEEEQGMYYGLGVGISIGLARPFKTNEIFGLPNVALNFAVGYRLNENVVIGNELYFSGPFITAVLINDIVIRFFPSNKCGFYLLGGIGYGFAGVFPVYEGDFEPNHGIDARLGFGYDSRLGETFHLGIEIANSTIFLDQFFCTCTFLMCMFSWY